MKVLFYFADDASPGANPEDVIENANILLSYWKHRNVKNEASNRLKKVIKLRKKSKKKGTPHDQSKPRRPA